MSLTTFKFDEKAERTINYLKDHYGAASKAEIIRKALSLLHIAAQIEDNKGKLIAKRDNEEQIIIIR